jgi:hypothetical protein
MGKRTEAKRVKVIKAPALAINRQCIKFNPKGK